MILEDQLTSIELSKRLKELGVKQESRLTWKRFIPIKGSSYLKPEWQISLYKGTDDQREIVSAFLAQELLELFPKDFHLERDGNNWNLSFNFPRRDGHIDLSIKDEPNFANVLASMLITLIKDRKGKKDFVRFLN